MFIKKFCLFLKKVLQPPCWLVLILIVTCSVLLPYIFIYNHSESVFAYLIYVISFYTLFIICFYIITNFSKLRNALKAKLYNQNICKKILSDIKCRITISLTVSLVINLIYSGFKFFSGIHYKSILIISSSVYYILLAFIRFLLLGKLVQGKKVQIITEYKYYRLTAVLMLPINIALSAIVLCCIANNKPTVYSDIYVITSAVYTFYTLTVSIIDIFKYRKYKSPIVLAATGLRFAQTLVSFIPLEDSMITQFGDSKAFENFTLALTGAGICIVITIIAVYMILKSNIEIKRITQYKGNL